MPARKTWVLVADGVCGRLFRLTMPGYRLTPALDHDLLRARRPAREIGADRPGRTFDSTTPARHAMEPPTDLERQEQIRFAEAIAAELEAHHQKGEFERLYVVAAPRLLGDLRQAWSAALKTAIADELAKDYSKAAPEALAAHLEKWLRG